MTRGRAAIRLRRGLLDWYRRNKRTLPWRRSADPYRVWISEVMLQQTTAAVVAARYDHFLARFPDTASLAAAREEDVLAAWSGLGYYHRARNLHRAARHLAQRHAGRFPRILAAALAVPGVGLYTASAVLSIAYGQPLPVVDGNVRRVLARLFALRGPVWRREAPFYNLAEELLDSEFPGDWNQALMELGATICTPRKPACPVCPLRSDCRARAEGAQEALPEAKGRRAPVTVTVATALVEDAGRYLLVRRAAGRLMGRMWELPQTGLESRGHADLERELRERHGMELRAGPLVAQARHAITFRRIHIEAYRARLMRELPTDPERFRWVTPAEMAALPLSSMTSKVLRNLGPQIPLALD